MKFAKVPCKLAQLPPQHLVIVTPQRITRDVPELGILENLVRVLRMRR